MENRHILLGRSRDSERLGCGGRLGAYLCRARRREKLAAAPLTSSVGGSEGQIQAESNEINVTTAAVRVCRFKDRIEGTLFFVRLGRPVADWRNLRNETFDATRKTTT